LWLVSLVLSLVTVIPEVATTHFKHASGGAATSQLLNLLTGTASSDPPTLASVTGAVYDGSRAQHS
jgi:hypothetical protein